MEYNSVKDGHLWDGATKGKYIMRKTILLIVLAMALGAYVYFYEIKGGEERKQQKEAAEKLLPFNKDSVETISIHSPVSDFVFRKTADGWQIETPVQTAGDETPIRSLLSSLSSVKKIRSFTAKKEKRASFGLGSRGITITLRGKGGLDASVEIGGPTSVGSNVYASVNDSTVAIVPSSVKTNATKTLFDWRDKKAVHFDRDKVRELHVHNPHGDFVFTKDGIQWNMSQPLKTKADRTVVDALVNKLFYAKIKSVVSETGNNLASYGLNKPAFRIELLSGKEKSANTVSFSKLKNGKAYGKDASRPHVFEVGESFMKPLDKTLFDFRDKSVVSFEKKDADSLALEYNGQKMIFHKDSTNSWVFAGGKKAKNWKITNVFSALSNLKAKKFITSPSPRRLGLDEPQGRFLVLSGREKRVELLIGKKKGDLVYAKNNLTGTVLAFEADKLESLFPKKEDLVETPKTETKTGEKH